MTHPKPLRRRRSVWPKPRRSSPRRPDSPKRCSPARRRTPTMSTIEPSEPSEVELVPSDPWQGPLLEAKDIVAGYVPEVNILNGCNLSLQNGELVGVIGPNGA